MVLQKVGNTITMKVQFNPVEYHSMLPLSSSHDEEHLVDEGEESSEASDSGEQKWSRSIYVDISIINVHFRG